jgi:hypothetical protein
MMMVMLAAGIACLLAGLVAIGFGSPISEFSFGNTLILAGSIAVCAGLTILSMWAAVKELKTIAERMASRPAPGRALQPDVPAALPGPASAQLGGLAADGRPHDQSVEIVGNSAPSTVPWQDEAPARDRSRGEAATLQEPQGAAKPRRNLMFSSMSRRERERAQARAADASTIEPQPGAPVAPPAAESNGAQPPNFDDAWPKSERSRSTDFVQRRSGRSPANLAEPSAARQPPASTAEDQPAVTVLKSGVVDGMAYSLYSDGSIEAQMPEGMMRFASIDELRAHLGQRP